MIQCSYRQTNEHQLQICAKNNLKIPKGNQRPKSKNSQLREKKDKETRYYRNEIFHANRIKLEKKIHARFLNPCGDQIVILYTRDTKLRTVLRESCSRLITGFLARVTPLVTLQESRNYLSIDNIWIHPSVYSEVRAAL
jgi:hypothetical protein